MAGFDFGRAARGAGRTAGNAASWAMTGASLGSVVPGVGNVIGGAIGGGLGLIFGGAEAYQADQQEQAGFQAQAEANRLQQQAMAQQAQAQSQANMFAQQATDMAAGRDAQLGTQANNDMATYRGAINGFEQQQQAGYDQAFGYMGQMTNPYAATGAAWAARQNPYGPQQAQGMLQDANLAATMRFGSVEDALRARLNAAGMGDNQRAGALASLYGQRGMARLQTELGMRQQIRDGSNAFEDARFNAVNAAGQQGSEWQNQLLGSQANLALARGNDTTMLSLKGQLASSSQQRADAAFAGHIGAMQAQGATAIGGAQATGLAAQQAQAQARQARQDSQAADAQMGQNLGYLVGQAAPNMFQGAPQTPGQQPPAGPRMAPQKAPALGAQGPSLPQPQQPQKPVFGNPMA